MQEQNCAVILAAGEGKRMKSDRPKVLSPVLFKPILQWVLDAAENAGLHNLCVVTGHKHEDVEAYLSSIPLKGNTTIRAVMQFERRGTGHAVMMAEEFLRIHKGANVLVLNGDAPFVSAEIIQKALQLHVEGGNAATVITAEPQDPTGYGRIVREPGTGLLRAIVEQKDADEQTLAIREINSGAYWFTVDDLLQILDRITNKNAQGEYYLTDAIRLLIENGKSAAAYTAEDPNAVLGANDCLQLNVLNNIAREGILRAHMQNGVEIPCTDGVIIGPDIPIGRGCCILPNTILRGRTSIGSACTLGPCAMLTDCTVADSTTLRYACCEGQTISPESAAKPFSHT